MATAPEPSTPSSIRIRLPCDFHVHFRDGVLLAETAVRSFSVCHRALAMPNLKPPVTKVKDALEYRERILAALPESLRSRSDPVMSIFLNASTTPADVREAASSGAVRAFKLYPEGATTNSSGGVDLSRLFDLSPVFQAMSDFGLLLLVHGEVAEAPVDLFDRERKFLQYLTEIVEKFPKLKIVLEHITTAEAAEFVLKAPATVCATITSHHLALNRNSLFEGGLRPHNFCRPILKREIHRQALVKAAISGNPKFFAGSDSAPHERSLKENSCGCAGCYAAPCAVELYTQIFDEHQALDRLEGFLSLFGCLHYDLVPSEEFLVLERSDWRVPEEFPQSLVPLMAGETIKWKIRGNQY